MNSLDLIEAYKKSKKQHGDNAHYHISELLRDVKSEHKLDFEAGISAMKARQAGKTPDHEQSWRAFKGKNLEKLLEHILKDSVKSIGLEIINGNKLERRKSLTKELSKLKRSLLIDYGEFGCHLPDVDLVIYDKISLTVIAVISCKVTLRERIAQTGYWKLKLKEDKVTKHIRVMFVTLDEDQTLTSKTPSKKGRAIAEFDTDGTYVLTTECVEESKNVKMFDKFINDLKKYKS